MSAIAITLAPVPIPILVPTIRLEGGEEAGPDESLVVGVGGGTADWLPLGIVGQVILFGSRRLLLFSQGLGKDTS
jgi:hypothetical protein